MINDELKLNVIVSKSNSTIMKISKLAEKKYRSAEKLFLCEGTKLFKEAFEFGVNIKCVVVRNDVVFDDVCVKMLKECLKKQVNVICVSEEVFKKLTTEQAPQGIITVCNYLGSQHRFLSNEIVDYSNEKIMFLESVRDPGNIGTIIRNAVAFNFDRLILSNDCVDLYSPKVVRATMGGIFKIKIDIASDVKTTILNLKKSGKRVLSSSLGDKSLVLGKDKITKNDAIVIGNEGHGVSRDVISLSDNTIFIPMEQNTESLNASVAATIFMWEQYK